MAELNPFASFAQGRQLAAQRRAEERLIEDREREAASRNRMAQLFAGGVPSTPEGRSAVVAEIARTDPTAAMDWQKRFDSMQPDLLARRKAEAPFIASELGNVADQASYERAAVNLAELGVDVSDWPEEYDPGRLDQVAMAARYLAEGAGSKQAYKLGPGERLFSSSGEVIAEGPAEAAGGGPFEGKSMDAQTMNILLTGDPASPEYAAAYQFQSQPRVSFDPVTGRQVTIEPNMAAFREPAGQGMVMPEAREPQKAQAQGEPISTPGARVTVKEVTQPKLSMTEAQQLASFDQARSDIASAEEILFPGGKFDRSAAAAAYGSVPGTEGRGAAQAMRRTIEVLLRLRTGAAAPESEVRSYLAQFMPSPLDNETQAMAKRDALKAFFDGTQKYFEQGRQGSTPTEAATTEAAPSEDVTAAGAAMPRPSEAPAEPPQINSKEEYDALPAGTEYRAPDGTLRIKG